MYFTWQSTIMDGIKAANQQTRLAQESSLDFPGGPNVIPSVLKDGRGRQERQERQNQRETARGILGLMLLALKMEDYQKHRNMDRLQQLEKIREWILLQNLQEKTKTRPCQYLDFFFLTQESPIWTSGLQNYKESVYCFKLLSLWYCYKSSRKLMQLSIWKKINLGCSSPQENNAYLLKKTYTKIFKAALVMGLK